MKLQRKLTRWVQAELIDQETMDRILAHETENARPRLLYAVTGIGALAILLGLISLVAANWDGLSDGSKLTTDLLIGIGLCWGLNRVDGTDSNWARDVLIAIIAGWTLASIALIGQIYQLGGKIEAALLFWCCLVFPLLAQGRSRLVGALWLIALVCTLGAWSDSIVDVFGEDLGIALVLTLAWLILALSRWPRLRRARPESAAVFGGAALVLLTIVSTIGTFAFYGFGDGADRIMLLGFALSAPSAFVIWRSLRQKGPVYRYWAWTVWVALCLQYCPILFGQVEISLLSMIVFMGFWALVTRAAWATHNHILFRFATFMVAVRVVSIYFELLGSLLDTALLLISGGVLTLMVARYWHQKNQALLSRVSTETGP